MKRKYSYIGLGIIILIFGIIVIPKIIETLSEGTVVKENRTESVINNELAFVTRDGEKRKVPPFEFINQNGDTITNQDYLGKVYVAEFFFTSCPTICPIMNSNLVAVDQEIDNENFGVASFSIDPRKDTPEVLKAYEKQYSITNPNWNLMTGDRDAIYDLARTGFTIYAEENPEVPGGFEHSGYFALVDQEGYLRSRKDEFGNVIIFYRGSMPQGIDLTQADEEPQIDILIEDIKILLDHGNKN